MKCIYFYIYIAYLMISIVVNMVAYQVLNEFMVCLL